MSSYDVEHSDPVSTARTAAVRAAREQDPRTRAEAARMTMAERLRAGFALSRTASRLRPRRRPGA